MESKSLSQPEKWILIGIPILFIIGSIFHFLYEILGESPIVALFAPVNESVWEHCKLVLWPMILWWLLYYCCRGKKYQIDKNKWFASALISLLVSLITMPALYYFYTGAFGVELLWVDILILLCVIAFGQLLGLHTYRYGKGIPAGLVLILLAAIVLIFMWFTFFPPHLPLFQDGVTKSYGIH